MVDYIWTAIEIGSTDARVNGRLNTLTHPAIAENGTVYIPLTLITDYYGWNLFNAGDGVYAIGYDSVSASGVNAAKAIFN